MAGQYWAAPISPRYLGDGAAYASSTTVTDVSPTPNTIIQANYLQPGDILEVLATGRFSTTGTPNLTLGVYLGGVAGTALCVTAATATPSSVTNQTFRVAATIQVRSIGSAASFETVGVAANIGAASAYMPATGTGVVSSLNTTAAQALTLGATWGTSNAANTLTVAQFLVTHTY